MPFGSRTLIVQILSVLVPILSLAILLEFQASKSWQDLTFAFTFTFNQDSSNNLPHCSPTLESSASNSTTTVMATKTRLLVRFVSFLLCCMTSSPLLFHTYPSHNLSHGGVSQPSAGLTGSVIAFFCECVLALNYRGQFNIMYDFDHPGFSKLQGIGKEMLQVN